MKTRIIDTIGEPIPKDVDETWEAYANLLLKAFGELSRQNGFVAEEIEQLYCRQRLRALDEKMLDSVVFNVPPAFIDERDIIVEQRATSHEILEGNWSLSSKSPFILLGFPGTGKSTFLENYFCNEVKRIDEKVVGIIVDFKVAPTTLKEFVDEMLTQVDKQLCDLGNHLSGNNRASLEILYKKEIERTTKIINDPKIRAEHIDRMFSNVLTKLQSHDQNALKDIIGLKISQLRSEGYTIWIVIDNIDQHFFLLHQNAFLEANMLAQKWTCPAIIAMRYIGLDTIPARNAYDSFSPRKLNLSLPDVSEMIEKRMVYFHELAGRLQDQPLTWTGNTMTLGALATEVEKCIALIASPTILNNFLLPLANYNVRRLLSIVTSAFQSYYFYFDRFNNDRYLPTVNNLEKRLIFAHLLKNHDYFKPVGVDAQERCLINIFENENRNYAYNQTIRIRLLQALLNFGRTVSLKQLSNHILSVFDYDPQELVSALRLFIRAEVVSVKNLLHPSFDIAVLKDQLSEQHLEKDDLRIGLSHCGKLHYKLISNKDYIDIMKFSTFILQKDSHAIHSDTSKTLSDTKKQTLQFLQYLANEELYELQHGVKDSAKYNLSFGKVIPNAITAVKAQFDHLEKALSGKNQSRRFRSEGS